VCVKKAFEFQWSVDSELDVLRSAWQDGAGVRVVDNLLWISSGLFGCHTPLGKRLVADILCMFDLLYLSVNVSSRFDNAFRHRWHHLQGYHRSHAGLVALKAVNTVLCMVYANSKFFKPAP